MEVTDNRKGDATMLQEPVSQIPEEASLVSVTTDGTCSTHQCHAAIVERGDNAIIPPLRNSQF